MERNHKQVLKTLCDAGLISRQAMKSIRGQLMKMDTNRKEVYLRTIISRAGKTKDGDRDGSDDQDPKEVRGDGIPIKRVHR